MKASSSRSMAVLSLVFVLILVLALEVPFALAAPVEKDVADGDEDSYLYGAGADEVLLEISTATGDVNGDGLPDLIMGHDQNGTASTEI